MKQFVFGLIIGASLVSFAAAPCGVIHPMATATNNEELTGEFLNGLQFKCPEGMKVHLDPKLFHDGMTYQEVVNNSAHAECYWPPKQKDAK